METLVSVCMITYNHEKYIAEAIDSVLMQKTNFDFEIVIGEDSSTDRTREIVLEYKAKHPDKIKLLLQEKNVGMMQNFIETYNNCSGKYIALLEGDDYWTDPYKLQKQVDILEAHPEYSMCFTARNIVDEIKRVNRVENYSKNIYNTEDVIKGFIAGIQTLIIRNFSDLVLFLKKNGNLHAGDRLLNYYCSLLGKIFCLKEVTACYRITGTGAWTKNSEETKRIMAFKELCSFYELIGLTEYDSRLAKWGMINFLNSLKQNLNKPYYIIKNLRYWYKSYLGNFDVIINLLNMIKIILKKFAPVKNEKTSW